MALSAKFLTKWDVSLTSPLDLSTPLDNMVKTIRHTFASGTGDDAADMMWHDQRTLTASASENLDLAGSLSNAFGSTQTFATVKAILVYAASGNTNNVNVSAEGTNGVPGIFLALGDGVAVKPDGLFVWLAPNTGATVTASTGDLLVVANSAGTTSVTFDIVIIGTSA